jgi:hypothetical protein
MIMIPDDSFHCNPYGAPLRFDEHDARLRQLIQQEVTPAPGSGRHLLLVCPICRHPWYKGGRHEYPRLPPEQLAFLGAALHVDLDALYQLPRALCTICSALHLGGMFSAEVYPHSRGYRFLWESVSPRRIQMLAIVCRGKGLTLDTVVQMAPEPFAEPMSETRSVLAWLESCPFPETMQAFTDEHSEHLARRCPAGSGQWRGYAWETTCAPLGGDALVSLAVAIPTRTFPPFSSLRLGWTVLARAMRAVL